jgi:hypothetical protein
VAYRASEFKSSRFQTEPLPPSGNGAEIHLGAMVYAVYPEVFTLAALRGTAPQAELRSSGRSRLAIRPATRFSDNEDWGHS